MNKVIITAVLLCTGLAVTGCEKTYSVKEFKTNEKLYEEWAKKCEKDDSPLKTSQNCKNLRQAYIELFLRP
ncbi:MULTISPECIES: EexN family lipoprotein [unclassified Bartonella]|uniref:EexN family lipoprotein n=1 Tax=unclassified Bartonella TaxID=2645622 RepID=UPI0035D11D72